MINITQYCKKFYKKPASFLDNATVERMIKHDEFEVKRGARGFTKIHANHLREFFLWLSPMTRKMVVDGKSLQSIIKFADEYSQGTYSKSEIIRNYTI